MKIDYLTNVVCASDLKQLAFSESLKNLINGSLFAAISNIARLTRALYTKLLF